MNGEDDDEDIEWCGLTQEERSDVGWWRCHGEWTRVSTYFVRYLTRWLRCRFSDHFLLVFTGDLATRRAEDMLGFERFGLGITNVVFLAFHWTWRIYTYLLSSSRLFGGYSTFLGSSTIRSCRIHATGTVARRGIELEHGKFLNSTYTVPWVSYYISPVDVIRRSTPTPSRI